MARVVAISDLHVDHPANWAWLDRHCQSPRADDILLLAGDIASGWDRIAAGLRLLAATYRQVFFVPGNHDLWVLPKEREDSLKRWFALARLCDELGIRTQPRVLRDPTGGPVLRIVPLLSWYAEPEQSGESLYVVKPGEDSSLSMWSDRVRIRWPEEVARRDPAAYFLEANEVSLPAPDPELANVPVVSFSHFLPRRELIFSSAEERNRFGEPGRDRAPQFNFSRVAGTLGLDRQVRRLGSKVHVHGHQHRNRDRVIDGVRYLSYCLGYPQERRGAGINDESVRPLVVSEF